MYPKISPWSAAETSTMTISFAFLSLALIKMPLAWVKALPVSP